MCRVLASLFVLVALSPSSASALPCAVEDDLSAAAARLVALGRPPQGEDVEAAVRASGSDAVNVKARWSPPGDGRGVTAWIARIQADADAPLVCGQSAAGDGQVVLVSARAGRLRPSTSAPRVIHGEVSSGFDRAQLVLTQADGELSAFAIDAQLLSAGFAIPDEIEHVTRVQLLARGPAGPRPVAERAWAVAGTAAGGPTQETETQLSDELSPEQQLLELREIHRAPAVRPNRVLTDVASAHARAVCGSGRVAHTLVPDGDPEARLRRAGVVARVVGETVARSTSVAKAYTALMRSASHRLTLLDRRFTEVGLATAQSGDHVCLVVLLAAWPRYVGR